MSRYAIVFPMTMTIIYCLKYNFNTLIIDVGALRSFFAIMQDGAQTPDIFPKVIDRLMWKQK